MCLLLGVRSMKDSQGQSTPWWFPAVGVNNAWRWKGGAQVEIEHLAVIPLDRGGPECVTTCSGREAYRRPPV